MTAPLVYGILGAEVEEQASAPNDEVIGSFNTVTVGGPTTWHFFAILNELDLGNNRWRVVYDLTRGRMYFRTAQARQMRYVDFVAFDFSCGTPTLMLDINHDLVGNVAGRFEPYTEVRNQAFIRQALAPIYLGVPKPLADAFKALWGGRLHDYTWGFACAQ